MMQTRFLGFMSGFEWRRNSTTLGGSVILDGKRLVTGILAVGVLLLSLGLLAVPTWAQDVPPATTLTVNKTDSPDPVLIGEILQYNIDVTNTGDETATSVVLTDDLPEGTALSL